MSIEIKLSRTSRTYRPNEPLEGKIILKLSSSISHQGIKLKLKGQVHLQVRGGSAGVIESLYGVLKPIPIINKLFDVQPSGRIGSGLVEIPFSVRLRNSGEHNVEKFYETFHGGNISIQYFVTVDVVRGYLHKSLTATAEFIIESEKEMANQANNGGEGCWLRALLEKLTSRTNQLAKDAKEIAKDDPRKITHSFKVGLAITLISLFYYFDPLYDGFGVNAMWAVMTVVVVFEFSVGGTLGRNVNRGLATLVAGGLGLGAHRLASLSGEKFEPAFLGLFVFVIAVVVTFLRFFPRLKARYDYGLLIFILTFSLICVSGYRDDEVLDMANKRLSTVLIGGLTAFVICILICPVWAGEDLHNRVANNINKLALFLEGFGAEYFQTRGDDYNDDKKVTMEGYKSILNSKSTDETLLNLAKWEPRHGRYKFRHPWDQYMVIGAHVQECAYRIDALNAHLNSELKISDAVNKKLQEPCTMVCIKCSKALKELASDIDSMTTKNPNVDIHIAKAKLEAETLKRVLNLAFWKDDNVDIAEIIQATAIVSLLLDIVKCTTEIAGSVNELGSCAKFKKIDGVNSANQQKSWQRLEIVSCMDDSAHISINAE